MRHQHYWLETGLPHDLVFLNSKFAYDCKFCSKRVWRKRLPLNPILPTAWEAYELEVARGNINMVMQPPMIINEES